MIKKKKKNIFYIASCAILATTVMLLIYVILVATGVIHLKQNKLVFYGNSAEKVYDGEPLSDDGWKLTAGKLQSGHTAFGSTVGSLTVPGETENRLSVWILDRNGSDVTDEYDIECVPGALRVRGIPLTFSSESKSKVYDGKPLTGFECRLLQGTLLPNHQAHYKSIGTITEVGTVPNDMHIYVTNTKTGEDVTYLYDITRENGTLEIHSRCVTVTTASDQKLYDGTPLTNGNFTLVGDFLPGHLGEVNVMGTILEPGEAKNVANVRIRDAEGNDVTSLYEIVTEFGTLTVISPPKADDVDKPDDSGGTLDGNDINNPNSGAEKETEYFKILTDYTGALLLRMNHFGDYSYDGWAEAPSGEDPLSLYLVSSALSKSSATANTAELKLLSGCSYLTPYYVEPSAVDSTLTEYSVPFYLYDYRRERSLPALPLEYAELELACREYAYENYLSLPDKTAEDMLGIYRSEVEKDGLNPDTLSGSERILWVESYIKGAAEYNLEFSEYPEDVDTAVYFLTEAKEGVCRHFATSAVAMYRALGIPARYTVGFSVSTLAGEERTVMGDRAHAWVEVYIDGLGWIALDPTGGSNQSDIQLPEPPEDWIPQLNSVLIASDNAQKMYDGSPLTSNNYHIYGLEDGYREEVYFTGSQLEVGSSPNSFSVKIYDADGNDVTGDFQIEKMEGELNVTPVSITVKTSSAEKNYNGTPLTSQEYTLEGDAVDGHKVSVKCLGTVTDPATVENDFEITVTDKNGNDVTSLYTVNREPGLLTVHPIPLIITGEDAEKVYDGTPLTCDLYRAEGGVLPNHSLKFDFTGKRTEPGSESNPFTVQVFNANEEDVTDKYLIESFYGNLTVKNREDEDEIDKDKIIRNITVESLKAEKTYDGTPLTRKGYTITSGNLFPGHRAEMNYTGSQTEAGSSKNTFEIKILDQDGNDATADYLITKVEGMLTVNPITLSVTTGDGTKTYDGTPLVQDLATYVASTEIPKGHTVTLEANGSQTEVGESENGYTFKVTNAEGKDVTHCFEAKDESVGMLTIAPATLTVTTNGDEKIYDGTPLRAEGFTHTGDLAK
ncbi:MAG: transglutaminase domain-containing protein, partial [Clostridia bacterium]|nr:transglutaminase domain-containing protein [Clostridia bacterium]